jgi:hypothetical protein
MIGAAHKTILYDYVLAAKAPAYFFRSLLGPAGNQTRVVVNAQEGSFLPVSAILKP